MPQKGSAIKQSVNKVWEWETKDSSCKELKTQRQQISKQPMRNLWATNHLPCTCVSQSIHGPNQVQLVEPSRAPHSHSCSDGNGSFQRHTHAQHARTRICIVLSSERGETKEVRPAFLASSSKQKLTSFLAQDAGPTRCGQAARRRRNRKSGPRARQIR